MDFNPFDNNAAVYSHLNKPKSQTPKKWGIVSFLKNSAQWVEPPSKSTLHLHFLWQKWFMYRAFLKWNLFIISYTVFSISNTYIWDLHNEEVKHKIYPLYQVFVIMKLLWTWQRSVAKTSTIPLATPFPLYFLSCLACILCVHLHCVEKVFNHLPLYGVKLR